MSLEKLGASDLNIRATVEDQVEKIESKCRYKADAHSKASARWALAHYSFSIPLVISSAVIGLAAFKKIFEHNEIVIGVLAITVSVLSALITFLNPNEKARNHHDASIEYESLKEKAKHLRGIEILNLTSTQEISIKLNHLINQKYEVDKRSPAVKTLSPRAMAAVKRLREMMYGSSGKKRPSKRRR